MICAIPFGDRSYLRPSFETRRRRRAPQDEDLAAPPITKSPHHMSGAHFPLFLLAALIIAAVPGPGIFYVAARTLSGGRSAGIASTSGAACGGLVHVVAGGLGVS